MLFRGNKPEVTVWKRFRSGQDGFTFTREGDHYEARVSANSERIVDLFHTLSETLPPAIGVYIEDLRTQQAWHGESVALADDSDSITPAIEKILSSDERRKELIALGRSRRKLFLWERCARETLAVYESIVA